MLLKASHTEETGYATCLKPHISLQGQKGWCAMGGKRDQSQAVQGHVLPATIRTYGIGFHFPEQYCSTAIILIQQRAALGQGLESNHCMECFKIHCCLTGYVMKLTAGQSALLSLPTSRLHLMGS